MNIAVIERWTAALRSGEYSQTTRRLQDSTGFCCIGVLCDIVKVELGNHWDNNGYVVPGVPGVFMTLEPESVRGYVNVPSGFMGLLTHMNDHEGKSFREIAAVIEERFLPLTNPTDESRVLV